MKPAARIPPEALESARRLSEELSRSVAVVVGPGGWRCRPWDSSVAQSRVAATVTARGDVVGLRWRTK